MNTLIFFHILAVYVLYDERVAWCRAQWFEDESRHFEYMPLELVHRGSFNNTDCLRDLLNCWEIVKPDIICSRWIYYESICGLMRRDCTDKYGLSYSDLMPIYESLCKETERT